MEKEFVPYELALRLKEFGFYCDCFGDYFKFGNQEPFIVTDDDRYRIEEDNEEEDVLRVPAPTFSQAFRWFREKHSLLHELISCVENSWLITIVDLNSKSVNGVYMKRINLDDIDENIPTTYEEAELACLDKLIEIVENK